jgi:hypothetical protein
MGVQGGWVDDLEAKQQEEGRGSIRQQRLKPNDLPRCKMLILLIPI